MSSFTALIKTGVLVMPIVMGLTVAIAIIIVGYIMADVPSAQVMRTFSNLGFANKAKSGAINKVIAVFQKQEASIEEQEKREKLMQEVNIYCLRLDMNITYDDIIRQGNQMAMMGAMSIGLFSVLALILGSPIFILLGVVLLLLGLMYPQLQISGLQGNIKKLNKSILFELPILTEVLAQMIPTGRALDKIFEDYLPQAGASRRDIELLLADMKNKSRASALADMSARMQTGDRIDEIGQLIDMIKSTPNFDATAANLEGLGNRIHATYVQPYIHSQKDKKVMTLEVCIIVIVVLVVFLYVSPTFIQMLGDMKEVV